jgi:hypothetical protein
MARKRRAKQKLPALEFYDAPDSSDEEEEHLERHKYMRFEAQHGGSTSTRSIFQLGPSSPVKKSQLQGEENYGDLYDGPPPQEEDIFMPIDAGEGGYLDPAYINRLGDLEEDPMGPKRKRTASVSIYSCSICVLSPIIFFLG